RLTTPVLYRSDRRQFARFTMRTFCWKSSARGVLSLLAQSLPKYCSSCTPDNQGGLPLKRQTTLKRAVSTSGHGLHTGEPSRITLNPAPAYTGYVFRRTDLNNFEIPAAPQYVARVSYATTLMRQGVMISTVEHLLAALAGSQ